MALRKIKKNKEEITQNQCKCSGLMRVSMRQVAAVSKTEHWTATGAASKQLHLYYTSSNILHLFLHWFYIIQAEVHFTHNTFREYLCKQVFFMEICLWCVECDLIFEVDMLTSHVTHHWWIVFFFLNLNEQGIFLLKIHFIWNFLEYLRGIKTITHLWNWH